MVGTLLTSHGKKNAIFPFFTNGCYREDLSNLSYITMCIKESLRLYPLTPIFSKLLSEDLVLNGQRIPKGS